MSSLIKRLTREVFRHHSNPWSAWTRLLSVPLVFVPFWTRSWKHAILIHGWLIANAIAFPEPNNDRAWGPRALLGEEMWIAKRPLDRAIAVSIGATAFGLGGVWGAYKQWLLPTAVCTGGQMETERSLPRGRRTTQRTANYGCRKRFFCGKTPSSPGSANHPSCPDLHSPVCP